MTSYSVLATSTRTSILATWPGEWADTSTTITSLTDHVQASGLAHLLTRISEDAWDAAAFLDVYPAMEAAITELSTQLRTGSDQIDVVQIDTDGCRHGDQWSCTDLAHELTTTAPRVLSTLSRAQRIGVADELASDAAARAEALQLLPTGYDPESATSRIWQMCSITRVFSNGLTGYPPEGSAGWLARGWGEPDPSPARRWGMRDKLVRLEQLTAACLANGGRGGMDEDPLQAHLVMPRANGKPMIDNEVFYIRVHPKGGKPWDTDPFGPLYLTAHRDSFGGQTEAIEINVDDDDGLARFLGDWTRHIPGRVLSVAQAEVI